MLISLITQIIIAGLVFAILYFIVQRVPSLQPFKDIALLIIIIFAILYLLRLLPTILSVLGLPVI